MTSLRPLLAVTLPTDTCAGCDIGPLLKLGVDCLAVYGMTLLQVSQSISYTSEPQVHLKANHGTVKPVRFHLQ